MSLSPEITLEIQKQSDVKDVKVLSRELSERFGQMITVGMIRQVQSTMNRYGQITEAKARASAGLDGTLDLTENVKGELQDMWRDNGLAAKDRIAAVKELRQWTQMGVDMSGIKDEDTGVVFTLAAEWNTVPDGNDEES